MTEICVYIKQTNSIMMLVNSAIGKLTLVEKATHLTVWKYKTMEIQVIFFLIIISYIQWFKLIYLGNKYQWIR